MRNETERKRERRARVIAWQTGEVSPQFTPGRGPRMNPTQRRRADESLAVENLRRAYWRWRANR